MQDGLNRSDDVVGMQPVPESSDERRWARECQRFEEDPCSADGEDDPDIPGSESIN